MSSVALKSWAAWSAGIESEKDWGDWARDPRPLRKDGAPALRFIPSLMRRRCDQLSRMMLHVAHECCGAALLPEVTSVFASRHGGFTTMVSLLECLAEDAKLSPARFSHSVLNTPAGLFSIWAGNQRASTCVSAGAHTFAYGFLEALSMLRRQPGRPVLLIVGDESIPEPLLELSDDDHGAHAVALLLDVEEGESLEFTLEPTPNGTDGDSNDFPQALQFVRWLFSSEPVLSLDCASNRFVCRR
ncbi:MAG: beta-ketoacyl synthase chain length factor [bacterium]|nr:beta-ketoacyl synthase chain length factor [bacterium]